MVVGGREANSANLPDCSAPISQSAAAEMLNVSDRSVRDAVVVRDNGTPELQEAVAQGQLPVSVAAKAAKLPKADQNEVAKKAKAGDASGARGHAKQKARKAKLTTPRPIEVAN